jgi:hypothetical protein
MPRVYELCADEAWTHCNLPLNRYWSFFGGIFAPKQDADRLDTKLHAIRDGHRYRREIKWSDLSPQWLPLYIDLVNELFVHLTNHDVRYRQAFRDRSVVFVPPVGAPQDSILDVEFKLYYQFIKHSFGLKYLPLAQGGFDKIILRLDTHSSQKHRSRFKEFAEGLPRLLGRTDLEIDCTHHCSTKLIRIQMCDVLAGAAGSYGNKFHDKRATGQRGMTEYQKCRHTLARHIYNKMRNLNNLTRGKNAFNWFESTGRDGNPKNALLHKIRIWKFIPSHYKIDRGWHNDHLDPQGNYVGPDIVEPPPNLEDFLG